MDVLIGSFYMVIAGLAVSTLVFALAWLAEPKQRYERRLKREYDRD